MSKILYELNWWTLRCGWEIRHTARMPDGTMIKQVLRHRKSGEVRIRYGRPDLG